MHKPKNIWVIEIDPHTQSLIKGTYPNNFDVAEVLGHDMLDSVRVDTDHHLIVDDNGLLHSHNMYFTLNITKLLKLERQESSYCCDAFIIENTDFCSQCKEHAGTGDRILSLCGKSMLVRSDENGDLIDCNFTLPEVHDAIGWLPQGYKDEPYMEFINLDDRVLH